MIRRTLPITPAIIGTKLLGVLGLISGDGLGGFLTCGGGDGGGSAGLEYTVVFPVMDM
jgi:hypothetical protein